MGFQISQIINKILNIKVASSDIAVPIDLQYHDLQDTTPLPTKQVSTLKITRMNDVGFYLTIPASETWTSPLINTSGNSFDFNILLAANRNFKVSYHAFDKDMPDEQTAASVVIIDKSGTSSNRATTENPIRTTSSAFKLTIQNTGETDIIVRTAYVIEHLGAF